MQPCLACYDMRYRERYGQLQQDGHGAGTRPRLVTIPRTVWTVATWMRRRSPPSSKSYDTANGMDCCNDRCLAEGNREHRSYDTANGMDCCNSDRPALNSSLSRVTIPRTVWTVATAMKEMIQEAINGVTIPRTVWTVATLEDSSIRMGESKLRYRERYGLLQLDSVSYRVSRFPLRYRERYGLLQLLKA